MKSIKTIKSLVNPLNLINSFNFGQIEFQP